MLANSDRPIPFERRSDLEITTVGFSGGDFYIVKDPLGLQYFRLTPEQYTVLINLDGYTSLAEIRTRLGRQFPLLHIQTASVRELVFDLAEKSLVVTRRLGVSNGQIRHEVKRVWKQRLAAMRNPLFFKLRGFDPRWILSTVYPMAGLFFRWWAVVPTLAAVTYSWFFVVAHFQTIRLELPAFQEFFGWPNLIWLWATLAFSKTVHELGHGTACKFFGRECHSIGIMVLLLSPTLYCDVSDSWTLKNKWKRMGIAAAGIYFEMILAAIAVFVWWHSHDTMLRNLALNVFFVSAVTTIVFNANPFIRRYDGYYILSDFLEVPNLRRQSSAITSDMLNWLFWGERRRAPDPFSARRSWALVLYGLGAAVYRALISLMIVTFLYRVLKPFGLESIGATLAGLMVLRLIWTSGTRIVKKASAASQKLRGRVHLWFWGINLSLLGALAVLAPIPWSIRFPVYVQFKGEQRIFTTVSGAVTQVHVSPGQQVSEGSSLLTLQNDDLVSQLEELNERIETARIAIAAHQAVGDSDAASLAIGELENALEERDTTEQAISGLVLLAPFSGTVVEPAKTPSQNSNGRLERWRGTPLDAENVGAFVESNVHVCSIRPSGDLEAIAVIHQSDRELIPKGSKVELRLESLPDHPISGVIAAYSDDPQKRVLPILSSKYGGELPTITDPSGERLVDTSYAGTIRISDTIDMTMTGQLRGTACATNRDHTLAYYFVRWLYATFHFKI